MSISRTPAGDAELSARALPLSVPARRLLGLLNAPMAPEAIAGQFRFGEWERHVADLVHRGLVFRDDTALTATEAPANATAATAAPDAPPTLPARPMLTEADLTAIRRKAVRIINDNLGPSGESVALRIERATSQTALQEELHAARRSLHQMRGRDAAHELYERVIALAFGPTAGS